MQQQALLQDVRLKLDPPLPAPRSPLPDLLDTVHMKSDVTDDQNMDTGESEDEWRACAGDWDRRNILGGH